ncbi:MAG: lipid-A-disaccharide synthase [Opitutaceae bacterium]|nr:lipid-A-disaccharide synthase [Opitutaceae bacterium]
MSATNTMLPFGLPPPAAETVDLLIVAGEHSGDEHAAKMVRELRTRCPGLRIAALGGPALAAAGAQLLHDLTATSVVGFVEVLKHLSFYRALLDATQRWIGQYRPRAVCLVDYPGFNLRLAAALRERGLTVKGGGRIKALYYISPQIWAWKAKRRFAMARDLDAMAVIFPFEPGCYADTMLPVEFVGHPFAAADYAPPVRFDEAGPILLLPGSRRQAVERIFPVLLEGLAEFLRTQPAARAVALYPSEEVAVVLRGVLAGRPALADKVELRCVSEGRARPLGAPSEPTNGGRPGGPSLPVAASAVLTSSGTMSMHCALAGIPGAVVYRTNPLTYLFGRWLVKVPYIGMANLLLNEAMYPEFIQGAATAAALGRQLADCTGNPVRREQAHAQMTRLHDLLRQPTSGSAADWLARQLATG